MIVVEVRRGCVVEVYTKERDTYVLVDWDDINDGDELDPVRHWLYTATFSQLPSEAHGIVKQVTAEEL